MVRGSWLAVASCLVAGCVRTPAAVTIPQAPFLAVVTWNTHAGAGNLTQLEADLRAGKLSGPAVGDYIILLQEAVEPIPSSRFVFFSPVRAGRGRTTGNAIVSTLPLTEQRPIVLPRERQPRGAVIVRVQVRGESLFVASAHLENRLGLLRGLFGDRARRRQAQALRDSLPDGHGILGGDMNTMLSPDEPAWRVLVSRFPDTPPQHEPTFRNRLTLDRLFFDLPDGWHAIERVVPGQYGSDHHPVVAFVY